MARAFQVSVVMMLVAAVLALVAPSSTRKAADEEAKAPAQATSR
jgi:hypothetical protein